jgi:hypothetical protein
MQDAAADAEAKFRAAWSGKSTLDLKAL